MTVSFDFGGHHLVTEPALLRPRAWTLAQSLWARDLLACVPEGPVLELCAGAGHIGLVAVHDSGRTLVSVDRHPVAAACTRANADRLGMADRVETRRSDVDEALEDGESFALVIADPPWVRHSCVTDHPEDPPDAIDGGEDGLDVARRCLEVAGRRLLPGGAALLQLGDSDQPVALTLPTHLRRSETRVHAGGVLVQVDAIAPGVAPPPAGAFRAHHAATG